MQELLLAICLWATVPDNLLAPDIYIDLMSGNNLLSVTLSIMQPTTELIANLFF